MPSLRKRKHRNNFQDIGEGEIPTPSIDQVLANIASNALASTTNEDDQDNGSDHNNGNNSDKMNLRSSRRKQDLVTQPPDTRIRILTYGVPSSTTAETGNVDNLKKNGRRTKRTRWYHHPSFDQTASTSNSQKSSSKLTIAGTTPGLSNNRTVTEMLNDLITRSVENKESGGDQAKSRADPEMDAQKLLSKLASMQKRPKNIQLVPVPLPETRAQKAIRKEINTLNSTLREPRGIDPRIESTVDQVVSSLRNRHPVDHMCPVNQVVSSLRKNDLQIGRNSHELFTQPTTSSSMASILSTKRQIIVHRMGTEQNDNSREQSQPPPPPQLTCMVDDDDEVQVVKDDEEEGEEEVAPFCKNCASEIPFIIKRLDRLDGMMDRMVTMVKKELDSIPVIAPTDTNPGPSTQPEPEIILDGLQTTDDNNSQAVNGRLMNHNLQLKIMANSPYEFNLQTLYSHNTDIRTSSFYQLNAALDSLVQKGYLLKSDTNPVIYTKNSMTNALAPVILRRLGMS